MLCSPVLGALFNPAITPVWEKNRLALFCRRCDCLGHALGDSPYLTGEAYTVTDAYLFTILGWSEQFAVDLGRWPALIGYRARIATRPAVATARRAKA